MFNNLFQEINYVDGILVQAERKLGVALKWIRGVQVLTFEFTVAVRCKKTSNSLDWKMKVKIYKEVLDNILYTLLDLIKLAYWTINLLHA